MEPGKFPTTARLARFLSVNPGSSNVSEPRLSSTWHRNCDLVPHLQQTQGLPQARPKWSGCACASEMKICDCGEITLLHVQLQSCVIAHPRRGGIRRPKRLPSAVVLEQIQRTTM